MKGNLHVIEMNAHHGGQGDKRMDHKKKANKIVKTILACGCVGLLATNKISVSAVETVQDTIINVKRSATQYPKTVTFSKDDIAHGTHNGCKWAIDKDGVLTIRSVSKDSDLSNEEWVKYKDKIMKVDIDVPYSSHLKEMFYCFSKTSDFRVKIDKTEGSASRMFDLYQHSSKDPKLTIDVRELNTSGITEMDSMFSSCRNLEALDLSTWDTSNVTNMGSMFSICERMKNLNISGFDTSNVTYMSSMFDFCGTYEYDSVIDVSSFDTGNVTGMECMFAYTNIVIGYEKWDVSKVKNMRGLFSSTRLEHVNLSKWRTPSLRVATGMFDDCEHLKDIDMSGMDMALVDDICGNYRYDSLVSRCRNLEWIKTPKNLKVDYLLPERVSEWYREDTKEAITALPKNVKKSITVKYNVFTDIYASDWQCEGARYAYDNNIMSGKLKTSDKLVYFDIESTMSRAEFVQTLYNYMGTPAVEYERRFKDVRNGAWYTNAILWAAKNDVVAGKGDFFDVDGKVTRQEMATMLYNFAKYRKMDVTKMEKLNNFADYNLVDGWAADGMKWAVGNQIINGKPQNNGSKKLLLDPKGNATRGEGATILMNFLKAYSH